MSLTPREIRNIKAKDKYWQDPEKHRETRRKYQKANGKEIYQRRKLREAGLLANDSVTGTHSKAVARDMIAEATKVFIVGNAIIIE